MSTNPDDNKDPIVEVLPSPPVSEPASDSEDAGPKNEKDDTVMDRDVSGEDEPPSSTKKRVTRHSIRQQEVEKEKEKFLSMDLESKRKLYRSKYTTLNEVPTWPEYYLYLQKTGRKVSKQAVNKNEEQREVREDLNKKLSLFQGDITTLEIDAIVNAANESLLGGGGVDGAIHRAAGPSLKLECETLNGCEPGDAKITCGYKLPAKYVIHTVGPRGENAKVLKHCYVRCLELVKKHELKTIAFPCISTGIFGYPNTRAASVVVKTLREWLEKDDYASEIERIILCLFLKVDVDVYEKLMPVYFPVGGTTGRNVSQNSDAESGQQEESARQPQEENDYKDERELDKP